MRLAPVAILLLRAFFLSVSFSRGFDVSSPPKGALLLLFQFALSLESIAINQSINRSQAASCLKLQLALVLPRVVL